MTLAIIIDIVLVALLLFFAWRGAKKGLFKSLASLLVVVVAFYGASFVASIFADTAVDMVRPLVEKGVEARVSEALMKSGERDLTTREFFDNMGLEETLAERYAEIVEKDVEKTGAALADAMVESMLRGAAYQILFLIAFVCLLLALNFVVRACNILLRLPVLRTCNRLGGAVVGLLEGMMLLFVLFWLLRSLNLNLPAEVLEESYVTGIFAGKSPLALLAWL